MSRLDVRVQIAGSKGDIYTVKLFQWDGKTKLRCDCHAGKNGSFCKHRRAVLNADQTDYDMRLGAQSWNEMQTALDETGLRARLLTVEQLLLHLEEEAARVKRESAEAKRRLVDICEGGV